MIKHFFFKKALQFQRTFIYQYLILRRVSIYFGGEQGWEKLHECGSVVELCLEPWTFTSQHCFHKAACCDPHPSPPWRKFPESAPEDHATTAEELSSEGLWVPGPSRSKFLPGNLCFSLAALTVSEVAIGRQLSCDPGNSTKFIPRELLRGKQGSSSRSYEHRFMMDAWFSLFVFLTLFFFFFGRPMAYEAPRPGISSEPQLRPKPQLQHHWILNPGQESCDGLNLCPSVLNILLIPLHRSGNSCFSHSWVKLKENDGRWDSKRTGDAENYFKNDPNDRTSSGHFKQYIETVALGSIFPDEGYIFAKF